MHEAVNSNDDSDTSVVVIAQQDWVIISTTDTIDDQQQTTLVSQLLALSNDQLTCQSNRYWPRRTAFPSGHNKMRFHDLGKGRVSALFQACFHYLIWSYCRFLAGYKILTENPPWSFVGVHMAVRETQEKSHWKPWK
ncbi:hypothetical protein B0T13DRAFT_311102 [Neurospora crassa]|nr:hypothetical protein B0T13DRAFT_311102 [Neurospora crassa]